MSKRKHLGKHVVCHAKLIRELKTIADCEDAEDIWRGVKEHSISCPSTFVERFDLVRQLTSGKSGAMIYLMQQKSTKKLFILKLFKWSRNSVSDEIYITCYLALQSHEYFPSVYGAGVTSSENPWRAGSQDLHIHDGDEVELYPFMILHYFQGFEGLSQLNPNKLTETGRLGVLLQVAHAFALAGKGFQHLDLHMDNILFNPDSTTEFRIEWNEKKFRFASPKVALLDFGWSVLPGRETVLKRLRSAFYEMKPNRRRVHGKHLTENFHNALRHWKDFAQENLDFRYFRLISFVVLFGHDQIPEGIHNFQDLLASDFFQKIEV